MEMRRRNLLAGGGGVLLLSLLPWEIAEGAELVDVRIWPADEYTRITIEHDGALKYRTRVAQGQLLIDLEGLSLDERLRGFVKKVQADDPYIRSIRVGQGSPKAVRMTVDLKAPVKPQVFELAPVAGYKRRLVVDLYGAAPAASDDPLLQAIRDESSARPSAGSAGPSSCKVLVMIDPGHGGEDPGASGVMGTHEKDIVLSIGERLCDLISQDSQIEARMTRRRDYFIPLAERVRLAQKAGAKLFVSVHADGWISPSARGSSVFALSEKGATSAAAKWLAQQQNNADRIGGINVKGVAKEVQSVLVDMSNTWKINYSLALGASVLREIGQVNRLHKNRVEQAGFAVLKGQGIPSILVETAFISNPDEEQKLRNDAYQEDMAKGILAGIRRQLSRDKSVLAG